MGGDASLKWETMLDDAEWDRPESLGALLAQPRQAEDCRRIRMTQRRHFAILALTIVAAVAGIIWYEARTGVAAIEAEITDVAVAESWAVRSGDADVAWSLVDPKSDGEWRDKFVLQTEESGSAATNVEPQTVEVEDLRLRSGAVMANVVVTDASGTALRETRFYLETPTGWLRTEPIAAFWGDLRHLETDSLSFEYHQIDEQAVYRAAPHLDEIMRMLHADLGLEQPGEPLVLVVAPPSSQALGLPYVRNGRVTVPSPTSLRTPANLSDEEILAYIVTEPLVDWVWRMAHLQTVAANPSANGMVSGAYWQHVRSGIRIWQTYAGDDTSVPRFLSMKRAPTYAAAPQTIGRDVHKYVAGPCPENTRWGFAGITTVQIAAWCQEERWGELLRHLPVSPWRLDSLAGYEDWDAHPEGFQQAQVGRTHALMAVTVVEYIVATYGREQLPPFIAAMRTYDDWYTLAPALFGLSAEEFESGWLEYLDGQQ